uniref:Lrk1 n=1 Tax=Arundo donax TaxID=35708 RepID=A0A0A8ZIF9_ARUDO
MPLWCAVLVIPKLHVSLTLITLVSSTLPNVLRHPTTFPPTVE